MLKLPRSHSTPTPQMVMRFNIIALTPISAMQIRSGGLMLPDIDNRAEIVSVTPVTTPIAPACWNKSSENVFPKFNHAATDDAAANPNITQTTAVRQRTAQNVGQRPERA